jgi:glutamate racemase
MKKMDAPIGVFDSGIGGLSVWHEIVRLLPREDTVYVADQLHMPYGSRSLEKVRSYSEGVVRFLLGEGAKAVVVACNSASAAALHHLRRLFPEVPFVGMEPAIKPAVERTRRGVVGVLATQATFQGELFAALATQYGEAVRVLPQVGWGLAQAVEAGATDGLETEALLRKCLEPLVAAQMDHLVLGCTHYPFLAPVMGHLLGPEVAIIDPAPAVARQTARILGERSLLRTSARSGGHRFYTSGEVGNFDALLDRLISGGPSGPVAGLRWEGAVLDTCTGL